ncbi:MAG: hypothetical protein U9R56_06915, partial [candidate division Zixibacteria bacterium]|nr:hypothetical protein [candidate division Zixibacteria bacterium]
MSKFKEQIRLEDKESYRYIFGGLAILAAATISQVYSGIGVFNSIPFISDPLFYKVMYWIGIITGASFLISGISQWLPLSRAHRKYNRERVRQFELLKKVEQLVHVENRQKHVLSKTIEYMVEHYDLLYGAVYGFQPETENMDLITSVGASDEIERYLGKMKFNINCLLKPEEENLSSLSRLIEPIPDKVTPPSMVLPLVIDNQVYSVFLLWLTADSEIDDEARVNLKIAIDIIARKIILDHHEVSHAFNQQREVWIDSIEKVIDYQKDLSENVVGIANCVMRMVPAELFSLTVMDSQRVVRQFSVGEARSVLNEVSHGLNSANSHVKRAFETGQPQYVEAFDKMESQTRADEIINRSGMISLAAIPIEYKG